MALTNNDYNKAEKENKGYLDISADEFYFDKVRPHMTDMQLTCKTDEELGRTLEKIINAADSLCVRKEFKELASSFEVFLTVATGKTYFSGIMKNASEPEKEKVRKLIELVRDLSLIIQCEKPNEPLEKKTKDRVDYIPPDGEKKSKGYNQSYSTHNMKELSKPDTKSRIPNTYY